MFGIVLGVGVVKQRDMRPALTEFIVYQGRLTNSILAISHCTTNYPILASNNNKHYLSYFQLQYLKWDGQWIRNLGVAWLGSYV